jgi:hypothetical protein
MSEYDPEYNAYMDSYVADPGATEITTADLAAVSQSAGEAGAARALAEVMHVQQQQQAYGLMAQASQSIAEAEAALTAWDPSWPTRSQVAYDTLAEHPTMIPPEALNDPMAAAEALYEAEQWGSAKRFDAQKKLKDADDEAFFRRLKREAENASWSARMARSGQTVHDVLDS